jgi:acetyltransferase-like isoleucine patch superfamily enzyme
MKPLLVVGVDSTLRDVYALAQLAHPDRKVLMLNLLTSDYYGFDLSELEYYPPADWDVCIVVNEFYINDVRRAFHEALQTLGYKGISVISPDAHVDATAVIGENVIIFAGCTVGADVFIGHHTVLRPNVVVSEDVEIGAYVTLEANVTVREMAKIGAFTTICANSSVARLSEIGEHCYLNLSRQYSGHIYSCTFFSPAFQNPVRVLTG